MSNTSRDSETDDDIAALHALRNCPEVFEIIEASDLSEFRLQETLRQRFSPQLVRDALTLCDLRRKASQRLHHAERLWLTRRGLEQATATCVAEYRAGRFPRDVHVLDLCCGLGSDAMALATRGPVTAIDRDPATALRCRWNVDAVSDQETRDRVTTVVADVRKIPVSGRILFADPDRRGKSGQRTRKLDHYRPCLGWMKQVIADAEGGAIRLGPASDFPGKFQNCEIELISLHGECREACVWFGSLRTDDAWRATVLPSGDTLAGDPLSVWNPPTDRPGKWIYDPDPSIVRSGLIDVLCDRFGYQRLDAEEEYLTSDEFIPGPFTTAFRIVTTLTHQTKELKHSLQGLDILPVSYEIKCRRVPTDATILQKKLPKGSGDPLTIFAHRFAGRSWFTIAVRHRD